MALDPILAPEALAHTERPVILDCRVGPKGHADYLAGHLPGAIYADLEKDLATPNGHAERGGRHPLPDVAAFATTLGRWGITPESHVVAYDDQNGANAAARLWWMLRSLGHAKVQILDGGLQAAVAAGHKLTTELPKVTPEAPYPTLGYGLPMADIDEVERMRNAADHRVLDVRASFRFRGESEPIDPIAGHIPGAVNLPYSENLKDGRFKTAKELHTLYQDLLGSVTSDNLIVHCGSGVTACHTLVALERAGLTEARLYVGSWSEWCRRPERAREPA
jgi:thiosulfate/3-mercaptopyruvate sulfurtransferase